jgi:serine/threonine-protein kinase RsbW
MPLLNAESSAGRLAFSREFTFAGDTEAMFAARDEIMQFLNARGVDREEEIDILVALQEALANAVAHGCRNDAAKTVRCTVEVNANEINLVIRDPGAGFDSYSDREFEDGTNLSNHGRGILLMRSLMDEVSYRHHGSELHLKKFRHQPD